MNFDTFMDIEQNYPIPDAMPREANQRFSPKIQLPIHKPKHRLTSQFTRQLANYRPAPTPEQIAAHIIALQLLADN